MYLLVGYKDPSGASRIEAVYPEDLKLITNVRFVIDRDIPFIRPKKMKKMDILLFIRQFTFGISQDLSAKKVLELLSQNENARVRMFSRRVLTLIIDGHTLDKALSMAGLDDDICFRVEMAIKSNKLAPMMKDLEQELIEKWEFKKEVTTAMIYPALLLTVMTVIIFIVSGIIVPALETILKDLNSDIPTITLTILSAGKMLSRILMALIIGLIVVTPIHLWTLKKSETYNIDFYTVLFKLKFYRKIKSMITTIYFTNNLHYLLASSIGEVPAIRMLAESYQRNKYIYKKLRRVESDLLNGVKLADAIKDVKFLTSDAKGYIMVGEETGNISDIAKEIAVMMRTEFKHFIKKMIALLEPGIMLVLFSLAGILIFAIAIAMNSVYSAVM